VLEKDSKRGGIKHLSHSRDQSWQRQWGGQKNNSCKKDSERGVRSVPLLCFGLKGREKKYGRAEAKGNLNS